MARFGNGARVSRCKGFVGVCSLLLILAALQQTQALSECCNYYYNYIRLRAAIDLQGVSTFKCDCMLLYLGNDD